jgi:NADPH:quinone reductase-like Zn-dependent oxidoreductase
MTQGAGLPETVFTVWANVFEIGRLGGGERLLVHGGTSGIGTTAIMLGVAFGAEVFVTAGTDGKCAFAEELGARAAINYREKDFVTEVERLVGREGIDVVLDMVGGDYIARNIALLRRGGRHLSIAFFSGSRVEVNFAPVLMRNLTLTGSVLRPRSREEKGRLAGKIAEKVWPLVETGRVTPVIDSTFPLSSAAQAHRRMESSTHMGKIVLVV